MALNYRSRPLGAIRVNSRRRSRAPALLGLGLFAMTASSAILLVGLLGWIPGYEFSYRGGASALALHSQPGVILFTSPNVDTCRQQLFDNATGRQRDDGVVDCKGAIEMVKKNQVADRVNAISDGFRTK